MPTPSRKRPAMQTPKPDPASDPSTPSALADFVITNRRGFYRPAGRISLERAVECVRIAIDLACEHGARDLLVDTTRWHGFRTPDTFDRFLAAVAWAATARGRLRLSMVARPEMIDPHKFGMTVARNRGLRGNIFTTEPQALAWLDHT